MTTLTRFFNRHVDRQALALALKHAKPHVHASQINAHPPIGAPRPPLPPKPMSAAYAAKLKVKADRRARRMFAAE
jgi:hypothetical protein